MNISDSSRALRIVLSVGLEPDQILFKNDSYIVRRKIDREESVTAESLARDLPTLLWEARGRLRSFIVRLRGSFIQVDDADAATIERLRQVSFMCVETSEANYQCWLALALYKDDFLDEVRDRFFRALRAEKLKGNGGAHGALRWPGSTNFKGERRGADGQPRVRIVYAQEGLRVTPAHLERAGLLAAPETYHESKRQVRTGLRKWPDYEKCLQAKAGDRSKADAQFVWISMARGFDESVIADKLAEVSDRADESGARYINLTIRKVRQWFESRRKGAVA